LGRYLEVHRSANRSTAADTDTRSSFRAFSLTNSGQLARRDLWRSSLTLLTENKSNATLSRDTRVKPATRHRLPSACLHNGRQGRPATRKMDHTVAARYVNEKISNFSPLRRAEPPTWCSCGTCGSPQLTCSFCEKKTVECRYKVASLDQVQSASKKNYCSLEEKEMF
jgi:hypothetical protein